jgi:UDP-N-acetylmuramate--alanine ligase
MGKPSAEHMVRRQTQVVRHSCSSDVPAQLIEWERSGWLAQQTMAVALHPELWKVFARMQMIGPLLFAPTHRVHFIGMGGIGMSGIAEILLAMGYTVSGSDLRRSPVTDRLVSLGARFFEGHDAAHAAGADVVVTSSAVPADNPEVVEARARHTPVIQRAEMLAELMRLKYGIAVAGMHGKTTTTSMIAAVLAAGGLDPTVVVGGRVNALGSNARIGNSQYLVAEADESDRSFLKLSPVLGVVTNLDREHMDCYRDMADVEDAFVQFMDRLPFYGAATVCLDDSMLAAILPRVRRRVFTYGTAEAADYRLQKLEREAGSQAREDGSQATFEVRHAGLTMGPFVLHVPGHHNLLNATAAVAMGLQLGIPAEQVALGLASFRGVDRRFQQHGSPSGVAVIDDYGHHPTEIRATLEAARSCGYRQIHVLFQPHRYTRTRDLMAEFATAFAAADSVELLPIYAASEVPIAGITSEVLAGKIRSAGHSRVGTCETLAEGVARLAAAAEPGDAVLTLGAGSVSQGAPLLMEALAGR